MIASDSNATGQPKIVTPDARSTSWPSLIAQPEFPQSVADWFNQKRFHKAVLDGDTDAVRQMLADKVSGNFVNTADACGHTPLHLAAVKGHVEVIDLLVKYGGRKLTQLPKPGIPRCIMLPGPVAKERLTDSLHVGRTSAR